MVSSPIKFFTRISILAVLLIRPVFSAGFLDTQVLEIGGQHGDLPFPNNPLKLGHWYFKASVLESPDSSQSYLDEFHLAVNYKTHYSLKDIKSVTRYGDKPYTYQFILKDGAELRIEGGVGPKKEFTLVNSKGTGVGFKIRSTSRTFRDYWRHREFSTHRHGLKDFLMEIKRESPPPLKLTLIQMVAATCGEWFGRLKRAAKH